MKRIVKILAKGNPAINIVAEFDFENGSYAPYEVDKKLRTFEDRIVGEVLLPGYYARDIEVK